MKTSTTNLRTCMSRVFISWILFENVAARLDIGTTYVAFDYE